MDMSAVTTEPRRAMMICRLNLRSSLRSPSISLIRYSKVFSRWSTRWPMLFSFSVTVLMKPPTSACVTRCPRPDRISSLRPLISWRIRFISSLTRRISTGGVPGLLESFDIVPLTDARFQDGDLEVRLAQLPAERCDDLARFHGCAIVHHIHHLTLGQTGIFVHRTDVHRPVDRRFGRSFRRAADSGHIKHSSLPLPSRLPRPPS